MILKGIDNVFFGVVDLDRALTFYQQMGFKLKFAIPQLKAALLSIGHEEPGLILSEKLPAKQGKLWVEVADASQVKEHCVGLGVNGKEIETATGRTYEISDESGNVIGFADYSKKPELARCSACVRILVETDISKIVGRFCFPWSTPEKTQALWDDYWREQEAGIRTVAVIESEGEIIGYGSLLRKSQCLHFANADIPEVNAIWIDENQRKKGFGTTLIKWIEAFASQEGYTDIGIGVGLYEDYGAAQKLYTGLGYVPDGNGITYKGHPTVPGQSYPLDDDLLLWLTKALR